MSTRLNNLPTLFTFQFDVTASGTPEQLTVKIEASTITFNENQVAYSASTIAFVDGIASADTITDSVNGFVTAGFTAGGTITVEGTTNNDGTYTIDTVVAGTITLISADELTNESAGTNFTIIQNSSSKDSITDSAGGFLVAGFQPGDNITVSGSASNDGTYTVGSVVAGIIILLEKEDLTAEAAGATVKIITPKEVTDGISVNIKAKKNNTGEITVGYSSATALNSVSGHVKLDSNESIGLQVNNIDRIWLDATVTGEGVEVWFEKNIQE